MTQTIEKELTPEEIACAIMTDQSSARQLIIRIADAIRGAEEIGRRKGLKEAGRSPSYTCDVCGDVFQSLDRVLRADRKRFCSDLCRLEAKRATIRASNRKQRQEMKAIRSASASPVYKKTE